jgi:hypothetical protein
MSLPQRRAATYLLRVLKLEGLSAEGGRHERGAYVMLKDTRSPHLIDVCCPILVRGMECDVRAVGNVRCGALMIRFIT